MGIKRFADSIGKFRESSRGVQMESVSNINLRAFDLFLIYSPQIVLIFGGFSPFIPSELGSKSVGRNAPPFAKEDTVPDRTLRTFLPGRSRAQARSAIFRKMQFYQRT